MVRISYCILFLFFLCSSIQAQSRLLNYYLEAPLSKATSYFVNPPFTEEFENSKFFTSGQLKEFGVAYFEVAEISKFRVVLRLFDKASALSATVELKKDARLGRFEYSVQPVIGDRVWIKVNAQETNSVSVYQAIASTGQEMRVKVEFAPASKAKTWTINNIPVKTISVFTKGRWQSKGVPTLAAIQRSGLNPSLFLSAEEEDFYTSQQLKLLQRLLLDIDGMIEESGVLSRGMGSSSKKPSTATTCIVYCIRFGSALPGFICDGGKLYNCSCPEGKGVFFIPECVFNIICTQDCNNFGSPILAITSSGDCVDAGFSWNSSTNTCSITESICTGAGWFWSSSGDDCIDTCSNPGFYAPDPVSHSCTCRNGASSFDCDADQLWYPSICACVAKGGSPILIDVDGNGFWLTDAQNGVTFDLDGDGVVERWSWTSSQSTNALLTLDRNGNGIIDNGKELFGNFTAQSQSRHPNGFLALAEYDKPENGGNDDGIIDRRDAIFLQVRLWQDTNHNAISESWELHTLADLGLESITLDYKESRRLDQYGNQFRYRARVRDTRNSEIARWAWDVFFIKGN